MLKIYIVDIFLENIVNRLKTYLIDYKYEPFMDMTFKLIEKEKYFQVGKFKYASSSKDNSKKHCAKREDIKVNAIEGSSNYAQKNQSKHDHYIHLPTFLRKIF